MCVSSYQWVYLQYLTFRQSSAHRPLQRRFQLYLALSTSPDSEISVIKEDPLRATLSRWSHIHQCCCVTLIIFVMCTMINKTWLSSVYNFVRLIKKKNIKNGWNRAYFKLLWSFITNLQTNSSPILFSPHLHSVSSASNQSDICSFSLAVSVMLFILLWLCLLLQEHIVLQRCLTF